MVMFIDASVWVSKFNDKTKSNVVGKWSSAVLPAGPKGAYGGALSQGMMIPASSKNKEAAYLFLQWYTSKKIQQKRALIKDIGSGDVTRISVTELPDYKARFSGNNWADATFGSVKKAVKFWIWEYLPEGQDLAEALSIAVSKAITGELTAKQALDEAQEDFVKILKKAKYLK
jgi:multiple sugar transport system substrate-binding protein